MITYGETHAKAASHKSVEVPASLSGAHLATIQPLDPCTNYTFWVSAVSKTGELNSLRD